ncbi:unnamed protein product [Mytilus coruscus]|uniref:Uncharacterized protein n=1 Tax=Mytilus coruscus TaxID=42192 RepID=A0A6J8CGI7_MYTCO|nr:unnamed protein product [Mytilus coruscus]
MTTADQNNEITGDKHKVNITSYDVSFNSVYKDYPKQCFPDKLSTPAGAKAKELQYEVLDDSLYEPQANMVAFRVPVYKLVPYDFPILIDIVQQVIEHNTPTDIQVEGSDEHFTDDQETTAKTLVDTTDQPFIKNDGNNNNVKHSSDHCCRADLCQSVVAYNQEESVNKLMHNFEDKFILALGKVCSQQTAMLCKSIETMQEKYAQNIKSYDTKFTDMLNKFSTITDKCVTVEKENAELKCKLKNQQHTNTLEQQIITSELEAKCTTLKTQFDNQKDMIQKLTLTLEEFPHN